MAHVSRRTLSIALAAVSAGLAAPALAQANFPNRPVSMVIPFAAGGPTDTVGRLIAQAMSADLGQPVVVENVGGAGGTLGAQRVAGARPDGYTILLHHIGMATIPTLYRRLAYDAVNGFETLGLDEIVSFAVRDNRRSTAVMERIGMSADPSRDFDHPGVPDSHPQLKRHVFYTLKREDRFKG